MRGFEYFLHELLRNNNKTTKYTFENYGISKGNILSTSPPDNGNFLTDCRYEQLSKAMSHFVVLGFGACDQMFKAFTRE